METRQLGRTGMNVTILGFGAAEIGFQTIDQSTVKQLVNEALDAGLNIIDTAECYRDSEELLGNAVSHRRKDFFLFTKCGHDGKSFNLPDWDPKMLAQSIDRSLQRLKTDRVDLLQIHSCTEQQLEQGDIVAAVQKARQAGKTRFIGFSGDSDAALWAVNSGFFDTLQISISLADQEALDAILPAAKKKNIGVIVKRPIANAVWRHLAPTVPPYQKPYWDRLQKLDYPFLKSSAEESISTALRFTLNCPGVTTAIVGTAKPGRWKENAEMLAAGPLPAADFNAIRDRWKEISSPNWIGLT